MNLRELKDQLKKHETILDGMVDRFNKIHRTAKYLKFDMQKERLLIENLQKQINYELKQSGKGRTEGL